MEKIPLGDGFAPSLLPFADPGFVLKGLPMPELRKDPIVSRWVIIATERAKRPFSPKPDPLPANPEGFPFCEGQEGDTPQEIIAYRDRHTRTNERGWRGSCGANKIPARQ